MARKKLVIDCATGRAVEVDFTPEEEAEADERDAAHEAEQQE